MSLKRPFVPKSDVKQRFTTTTIDVNVNGKSLVLLEHFTIIIAKDIGCSTAAKGPNFRGT